jgi:hypothetical protein
MRRQASHRKNMPFAKFFEGANGGLTRKQLSSHSDYRSELNMLKKTLMSIFCVLVIGGCNTTGSPAPQSPAAAKNTGQQQASAQKATSTSQNSGQASQSQSNTQTLDASVKAVALVAAIAAASGKSKHHSSSDRAGTWNVSTEQGRICQMTLQPLGSNAPQGQVDASGCFGKLFGVNKWIPRGNEIILSDAFGKRKATLRAYGRNRLDGDGISMWR